MINKAILVGRLTKDPELKETSSGVAVCSFTVAVNRSYKTKAGEYEADFIDCIAWRMQAEHLEKYFSKGQMIGVVGSIQKRSYKTQAGDTRYVTEVIADEIRFIGSKKDSPRAAEDDDPAWETSGDTGAGLPFDM